MLIFDTKIANFKPRMKQINRSKMLFTPIIKAAKNWEISILTESLKKCHYL